MNESAHIAADLRAHQLLCEELLALVEREGGSLRTPGASPAFEFYQLRKSLLPRLEQSLLQLRKSRDLWQGLPPEARSQWPEVANLICGNQELIMKIILLDRENEQSLLRRGLMPAHQLPAANRQRPHFVADLYRRHTAH